MYDANETGWANRSPEEMAFVIATWFAGGGSHHNYYMWYGGNHVGWTAANGIASYYADGVNYHADGLPNEPKRSHLYKLHQILAQYQDVLLHDSIQYGNEIYLHPNDSQNGLQSITAHIKTSNNNKKNNNNTTDVFAYVYKGNTSDQNITFLINNDASNNYTVEWKGNMYYLPNKSVSIVSNNGKEIYNTAKINRTGLATERVYKTIYSGSSDLSFESWNEILPIWKINSQNRTDSYIFNQRPLEQLRLSVNNNQSEYLIYETEIETDFTNSSINSQTLLIKVQGRKANSYYLYLNGIYIDTFSDGSHSKANCSFSFSFGSDDSNINLNTLDCSASNETCILTIISSSLGISNGIEPQGGSNAQDKKGIVGQVRLYSTSKNKTIDDYTYNGWTHWIGTTGENLNVTGNGENSVKWNHPEKSDKGMTWYRTYFETPDISLFYNYGTGDREGEGEGEGEGEVTGVFLLDIGKNGKGFQRGHWWLNGKDMGHYNSAIQDLNNNEKVMVQEYYYIPLDYLLAQDDNGMNQLVFQEELPLTGSGNNFDISSINLVYSTFEVP